MPMYDPDAEGTVPGTIEEVNERGGDMGMTGTHLVIKTDEETVDVHLGPSMYLAEIKIRPLGQLGDLAALSAKRIKGSTRKAHSHNRKTA